MVTRSSVRRLTIHRSSAGIFLLQSAGLRSAAGGASDEGEHCVFAVEQRPDEAVEALNRFRRVLGALQAKRLGLQKKRSAPAVE